MSHPYSWNTVPPHLFDLFSHEIEPAEKLCYMERAIAVAEHDSRRATVGAVIVKNGTIVGSGHRFVESDWSKPINVLHAEQIALADAGPLAQGADLYATLEPCYHRAGCSYGYLPCSEIILQHQIKRVIIGLVDQDARNKGKGVELLNQTGVHVEYAHEGLEHRLYDLIQDGFFPAR